MPVHAHHYTHRETHGIVGDPVYIGVLREGVWCEPGLQQVKGKDAPESQVAQSVPQTQGQEASYPG